MFQFPAFPSYSYVFTIRYLRITTGGFPHSEICGWGYVLLTTAYRSLSRPSSAPSAKASAWCSLYLTIQLLPNVRSLGLLFSLLLLLVVNLFLVSLNKYDYWWIVFYPLTSLSSSEDWLYISIRCLFVFIFYTWCVCYSIFKVLLNPYFLLTRKKSWVGGE